MMTLYLIRSRQKFRRKNCKISATVFFALSPLSGGTVSLPILVYWRSEFTPFFSRSHLASPVRDRPRLEMN